MSDGLVAFILAVGGGSWVYAKMYRRTGGNNKPSAIMAAVTGVAIFIFTFVLLGWIIPNK